MVDIGGGSTEFVLGDRGGVRAARSVDIGCVRLTERHLHGDPPSADEIQRAESDIRAALVEVAAEVPVGEAATLVGLAGSVTTVAALALGLPAYQADTIHGARIPVGAVRSVTAGLLTSTRARRAALPVMHPGRVDVIGGGALVLRVVMDALAIDEVVVSEHDISTASPWPWRREGPPRSDPGARRGARGSVVRRRCRRWRWPGTCR